ncbi:cyclic nucleotide-binding domain-containing protein [Polyangium mundeleinium]|uniref:Cyclic nucleotide-binding domain-containing protein n=1 Tax=Polyangium mundeleinium TaxID=2995306 RepID=A0ABT5EQ94_9BACT|nr:cyclic nucleotide-binding domain-containing protein [Polyangium mundeleinium]MDC0743504.1 cyclic nucleotide-binding domain-containing protein [Polyangium mundeleinium]
MTSGSPATSGERAAWPAAVWEAPVFRGLDARARREIEDAGRMLLVAEGEVVYRAGAAAPAFYVVAEGMVALSAVRRGEDHESELRAAGKGASFGEEATAFGARSATATARASSRLCEVPAHVFQRAAARSGKAEVAERLERILRRAATRDLLHTMAFARALDPEDVDVLLDAARYQRFERGQPVYREGDPSTDLLLVADGMIQIQTDDGERLRVRAYLGRGDFFGDAEIEAGTSRLSSAVASGPSLLIAIDARTFRGITARHPDLFGALRRIALDQQTSQRAVIGRAAENATQHAFRDLYRLKVARSLLVIDLETCVRCGHCAWGCAEMHGEARIVRRGDKMVARVEARSEAPRSLLLPNSCQHCANPSCMIDCPTGAIGREPDGEVFIREALCTGCGACAKACPWDNIQMAARPAETPRPAGGAYPDVAVKCDLCRGYEGPACVQVCPTGSIFRMNPSEELADVRDMGFGAEGAAGRPGAPSVNPLLGGSAARAEVQKQGASAAGLVAGGAIAGAAVGVVGMIMHARGLFRADAGLGGAAGILAAVGFVLLVLYAVPKRLVRLWMRKRAGDEAAEPRTPVASRVRPQLAIHLALGLVTTGLVFAHAPMHPIAPSTAGGALRLVFLASALVGGLSALAYAWIPRRMARIERSAALPEDFAAARRDLVDRLYREVSGKSDLVKKIFDKILVPFAMSSAGPLLLLASGRTLRQEEEVLRARIERVLEGRGKERLAGLDGLVRIVVELRALPAQRLLLRLLRVGLPLHILTFGMAMALLVVHVAAVMKR